MNKIIRKLSIGSDYPNKSIHYQLGKEMRLTIGEDKCKYKITGIYLDKELFQIGKLAYNVYISDERGEVLWKMFSDMPMAVEYKIDFE